MEYYKVIKDGKVIDVLKELRYLKYHPKFKRMFNANGIEDAQAILSSDEKYIWHVNTLCRLPVEGYETVRLVQIDQYEYDDLQRLNKMTYDEIVDSVILSLIEGGML